MSSLHKKFQVASTYDTNVECQIWRFCYNLFLSYADNRHTFTHTHIHTDQSLKMCFSVSGTSKLVNPSKSSLRKFDPKTILSFYHVWVRESKNLLLNFSIINSLVYQTTWESNTCSGANLLLIRWYLQFYSSLPMNEHSRPIWCLEGTRFRVLILVL